MAVDQSRSVSTGNYGPIEAITLDVLRQELNKLRGTLSEDTSMGYERCLLICDEFIDELGKCINISVEAYPEDKELYYRVFDGLQEVINLIHGDKPDLVGSDGKPRLMDHQESRMTAADRLTDVMEELAFEVSRREAIKEAARMEAEKSESRTESRTESKKPRSNITKEGASL